MQAPGEVNESLLANMCAEVAQLSLVPELVEEAMTSQKLGGQKQAFAELCMKVWRCCWDEKVAMNGAIRSVFVELRKTETTPAETLRGNGFGSKVVSLYLAGHAQCQAWLRALLAPFVTEGGDDETEDDATALRRLLMALCRAAGTMPRHIRFMASSVERETRGKPTHDVALVSLLVLRFLLPALIAPAAHGVVPKEPPLAKARQTRLVNLARAVQQLASHKTADPENSALLSRFLLLAVSDPTDFADMTRIGATEYALQMVPIDLELPLLLQLVTMVAAHSNDNFERDIRRCKFLISNVGNAEFHERVAMEKPKALPPVGARAAGTTSGASGSRWTPSESEDDSDDSSTDDETNGSWALCRFIRSFLVIPSVVRGEREYDSSHSSNGYSAVSKASVAEANRERREENTRQRPPRLSAPEEEATAQEGEDEQSSTTANDNADSEDSGSLSSFLGLSGAENGKSRSRAGSSATRSGASSPRASMMKHVLTGSITDEVWSM
jgi:hypothetical protein